MTTLRTSREMQDQVRLLFSKDYKIRRIAKMLGISRNTVRAILRDDLPGVAATPTDWRERVDWNKIFDEHARRSTPIKTLWAETVAPDDVTYMVFWHEFNRRKQKSPTSVTMRLEHRAGERTYFDFADGIDIIDRVTERRTKTQLLVTCLPFSSRTEAEFILDQKQPSMMRAMENAFYKIGGVTPYVVVDNLKSAVQRAHLYDPDTNKNFLEFANHMGFAVLPARPYKPRDKAAVEAAVGLIQRQFYAEVRDQKFFSLEELNSRLRVFLERLNREPMKDHGNVSRLQRFEAERELLKATPSGRFEISEWKRAKVHPDCHIQVDRRFYSVPFQFVGSTVDVRVKAKTIEVFELETREPLVVHPRLVGANAPRASTLDAHYPEEKAALVRFDVQVARKAAHRIGPKTEQLVNDLFSSSTPLKFLRRVQGILDLARRGSVSPAALEHASERALLFNKKQLSFIKDAALFFERRGPASTASVTALSRVAPIRSKSEVFLHQQPNPMED